MGAGACCKVILTFALGLIRRCGIGLDGVAIAPMTWGGGDRGGTWEHKPKRTYVRWIWWRLRA
eukprot:11171541-Lingulodinium_polyedra.AAC.1